MRHREWAAAVALIAGIALLAVLLPWHRSKSPLEIRVRGAHLVDGSGRNIRLFGVNRSGTEYQCTIGGTTGAGIFSGPDDAASIASMVSWHINAVRVPLNEDCWLGINGVNPAYTGKAYQHAVDGYIRRLNHAGLIAIVDLHWNAPGAQLSSGQRAMADADHAPAFWSSVATRFKANRAVMFDLYNEPDSISWSCWRSGCVTAGGWRAVGMQTLIDVVRRAGARQPVIASGLGHANDLSGWLAAGLHDPLHQLVAGLHMYNTDADGYCNTAACWDGTVAPVSRKVPVVTAEIGEHDRRSDFVTAYMHWADHQWRAGRSMSVLAWAWDAAQGETAPSLITSYDGTPTGYGLGFRTYLAALFERGEIHR